MHNAGAVQIPDNPSVEAIHKGTTSLSLLWSVEDLQSHKEALVLLQAVV